MKFLKFLFSRFTIVIFAILLQVAFIVISLIISYTYYPIINTVVSVIAIFLLLYLINKDMSLESKIIWIILVLLVPIFGVLLYSLFGRNFASRKHRKYYKLVKREVRRNIYKDDIQDSYMKNGLGKYYGQFQYIYKSNGLLTYENTETKYFSAGELWFEDLKNELKRAEKYIFMEYFVIERGVMWDSILDILVEKVQEGLDVRVMYDDIGSISKLPYSYAKKLCRLGIKCVKFNSFTPIVSAFHNNRDHRKMTIIDGRIGYMSGSNLADEYINIKQPFGYWKDSIIKLTGECVDSLVIMFLYLYTVQNIMIEDFSTYLYQNHKKLENKGHVAAFGDGPKFQYRDNVSENVYLNIINQSEQYLWITTPYLIIDDKLKTALCLAAKRGVDVRIVTPRIPDKRVIFNLTRSNYRHLQAAGVKIYEYTKGFIHSKQFLCDDQLAIVGTINLDYRSLLHHFECGVLMYNTESITEIKEDFQDIFAVSEDMTGFKQNMFVRLMCSLVQVFTPLL